MTGEKTPQTVPPSPEERTYEPPTVVATFSIDDLRSDAASAFSGPS
jgi:hypothetical protein